VPWVFRLDVLLDRHNEARRAEGRSALTWAQIAPLLGVSRQALQNLASNREPKATNTRFLEAVCRFFGCGPQDVLTFAPPLQGAVDPEAIDRLLSLGREPQPRERPACHVDVLYGEAALARWPRDRTAAEG
jgi:DNA-binding Xre family transcriptional regulator